MEKISLNHKPGPFMIYEEFAPAIPPKTRPSRKDDCLTDEERDLLKTLSNNFTLNARQILER